MNGRLVLTLVALAVVSCGLAQSSPAASDILQEESPNSVEPLQTDGKISPAEMDAAEPVDQRKFYATVGATGGYALFKEKYGGELQGQTIEKERWYGGAFGGVETRLMWPVAARLDLGVRLDINFGRLRTACESTACGMCLDDSQDDTLCDESSTSSMDCFCDYSNRFAVLAAATAVLAVSLARWIWLEAQLGLLLWVDGNTEPSMSLLWAGAVGFHLADFERVLLFLRLEIDGAWRIDSDQLGILPLAAIGVRF